jgi:acyl-coenzyme A synthetase/AMP-(fatty) acid ligase
VSAEPRLSDTIHTIPEALAFWAEHTPDAPALIVPDGPTITYDTLWRGVTDMVRFLRHHGVRRQDRVVLLVPEGPLLATTLLGTMSAAIATPLSSTLTISELRIALRGLGAVAAIVLKPVAPGTMDCLMVHNQLSVFELDTNGTVRAQEFDAGSTRRVERAHPPRAEDIAVVLQTSGTTGTPKWVPRTHGILLTDGRRHRDRFGVDRSDRALSVAPMTLSLGLTTLIHTIAAGAALICPPSSDLARLWEITRSERPTWMFTSAGFATLLTQFLREHAPCSDASSFRFVRVTSGPLAPEVHDELAKQLGAQILMSYSSSEAGGIAMALPPPAVHKPGSAGQPVQDVRIVDATGNSLEPETVGEIVVRGPQVFAGYLDDPTVNAASFFPGGWLRTGDLGYLDADGYLFVRGRVNELINRGGEKIAPLEVDRVLLAHPAVSAAATFAIPDDLLGEDIAAAVVLVEGREASRRELRRWMVDQLAPSKVPRRIWFVDNLPRTATGKVQRRDLSRRFSDTGGAPGT